ncbi:YlbL family protein [Cellulomonas fengjieae]|uniref:YlbL family protein n=1 Tax=Cellulomonas fengjieae TaxID=2819978 RepID=UPI0027DB728E|nr:S16 family serine protease [Cellulomonas fengjieae]
MTADPAVPGDDVGVLDQPSLPSDVDAPFGAPDRVSPRSLTLSVGLLSTAVLVAVLAVMPVPYAVSSPGPTRDVLGEHDGTPLIQIEGAETFDATGELRLTTVSGTGGPGFPSSVVGVLEGWFSPDAVVQPVELLYPPDRTQDEIDESNTAEMVSSQENAAVAALTELGYEVPATLVVAGAVEGTDAEGKVEEGDVIVALDGAPVPDYQGLITQLERVEPGTTVTLTVRRHGQALDIPIVTGTRDGGKAQIGVFIDPTFDMPVDISISIDDIGGPSAGTMFALGIIDKMTPEDEAAGEHIAGTGTIDVTGEVGPIGGIRQKLAGAARDGATWFLAPADNCPEVVGHVPDGLRVVPVETLHEARETVVAIGAGTTEDLPSCQSSRSI